MNSIGYYVFNRVFLISLIGIYIILNFVSVDFISTSLDWDSGLISKLAKSDISLSEGNSYASTGWFFSLFGGYDKEFVILFGIYILYYYFKKIRHPVALGIAAVILIPAIFTILLRPQKETVVLLLTLAVLSIFQSYKLSQLSKIIFASILYCLYAYFFRQYYFLIGLLFVSLVIFFRGNIRIKAIIILLVITLLFFVPSEIFHQLQSNRDIINQYRVIYGGEGNRTVFLNLFEPNSLFNFIFNYGYAFFRLNLPILFNLGHKELFLTLVCLLYAYLIIIAIKSKSELSFLSSMMMLAHITVFWLFEPDLGSYTRHLSSLMLYTLSPILIFDAKLKR